MSTKTYNIKIHLVDTMEVFTVSNVCNKTAIRTLKTALELIAGIPSHLQRIMYLDQGDMEDSSTLKHHDVVPGAQLSMHIWKSWLSLIQSCVSGKVQKLMSLGVTPDSTFTNPNVQRMSPEDRIKYFASRSAVALYVACHRGRTDVVKALLDAGADISATTKFGRTALHVAAASGQEEIIETLLEYGAGDLIEHEDTLGQNCLQVAVAMEHKSCARTLFLFQWRKRAVKMPKYSLSKTMDLMAHQIYDSASRTWLRGAQQQIYHGTILPPQEFRGTAIDSKRSDYALKAVSKSEPATNKSSSSSSKKNAGCAHKGCNRKKPTKDAATKKSKKHSLKNTQQVSSSPQVGGNMHVPSLTVSYSSR